jgi:hypothetical protein
MHGGYRGRGTTINWNTTGISSTKPNIEPLPEPYPDPIKPLEPPPLPNVPIKLIPPHSLVSVGSKSHPNIAGIVGLTLGGIGALTAIGVAADRFVNNRSGIVEEQRRPFISMRGTPEEEKYIAEQEASDPELFLSRRPDQSELERRERDFDWDALRGGDPNEDVVFQYH